MTEKSRKRAVVICPGRGTYNRAELGYLSRYHRPHQGVLEGFDEVRLKRGKASLESLDSAPVFQSRAHLQAENAAPLIYSCAYFDFLSIDRDAYDIVAVTGNSMGWYIALACAGALTASQGFELVSGMAERTQGRDLGGQLIYPVVDSDWRHSSQLMAAVERQVASSITSGDPLYWSIAFGGYAVLAGSHSAIRRALAELPKIDDRYPLELPGHSAFHTPLMESASRKALNDFPLSFFNPPQVPLIDGLGKIWYPCGTHRDALRDYTLTRQVQDTYHFSAAVRVALREFAPDVCILTGPGATMGGAVAQVMIAEGWSGLTNKADFIAQQAESPVLLAMGVEQQRAQVVSCVP